ncbi:MAG TPA: hypothetical protein VHP33_10395 [Polyangiaceae bacterium]|nr:hypothetical protein [Polyangiaceae bacterium]
MHTVDIRVGSGPHRFISEQAEQQHQQQLQAFRAAIPPTVQFVVAPGESITRRDGRVITAGQPITTDDVDDDAGWPETGRPRWRVFRDLLHDQRLVENYQFQPALVGDPNLASVPPVATR